MFLYSSTIVTFISRLKGYARNILASEIGAKVYRDRFELGHNSYPINIVVFEDKRRFGFFDYKFYQIGINKSLMYTAKTDVIMNVLRHELAHMMTYLRIGFDESDHGNFFKQTCNMYGFGSDIGLASSDLNLENDRADCDISSEKIIRKVKKLLMLASSSNSYESELATVKANQLLLQHNLKLLESSDVDETICVKRVLHGKRKNGKYRAINSILQHFFVQPVFNYGDGFFYLEVLGTRVNVEIADYIANYLWNELERLWNIAGQKNPRMTGVVKKNSFMSGIASGYILKIEKGKKIETTGNELVKLEKTLNTQVKMVYPRLSSSYSAKRYHCDESSALGQKAGNSLNINPGIKSDFVQALLLS